MPLNNWESLFLCERLEVACKTITIWTPIFPCTDVRCHDLVPWPPPRKHWIPLWHTVRQYNACYTSIIPFVRKVFKTECHKDLFKGEVEKKRAFAYKPTLKPIKNIFTYHDKFVSMGTYLNIIFIHDIFSSFLSLLWAGVAQSV
jgi:hypothetical protein